jgi:hypothetical protein
VVLSSPEARRARPEPSYRLARSAVALAAALVISLVAHCAVSIASAFAANGLREIKPLVDRPPKYRQLARESAKRK